MVKERLNRRLSGKEIAGASFFIILFVIPSSPGAFPDFRFEMALRTSAVVI